MKKLEISDAFFNRYGMSLGEPVIRAVRERLESVTYNDASGLYLYKDNEYEILENLVKQLREESLSRVHTVLRSAYDKFFRHLLEELTAYAVKQGWEEPAVPDEPEEDNGPIGHRLVDATGSDIDGDSSNVPVNVWLEAFDADGRPELAKRYPWARYQLRAANYMPRKNYVSIGVYLVLAEDVEDLKTLLREKVLPLYKNAVAKIEKMIEKGEGDCYYWDEVE